MTHYIVVIREVTVSHYEVDAESMEAVDDIVASGKPLGAPIQQATSAYDVIDIIVDNDRPMEAG